MSHAVIVLYEAVRASAGTTAVLVMRRAIDAPSRWTGCVTARMIVQTQQQKTKPTAVQVRHGRHLALVSLVSFYGCRN